MMKKGRINSKTLYLVVASLLLFALLATSARIYLRYDNSLPGGDTAWSIRLSHEIEAMDSGAAVFIPPPWDTRHARLYSQSLSHPGLRQRRTRSDRKERDIVLTAIQPGYFMIETTFHMHVSKLAFAEPKRAAPSETNRDEWLSSSDGIHVASNVAAGIIEQESRRNPEPEQLIEALFNYASSHIRIDRNASSNADAALNSNRATALGATRALVALLRTAHLPTRIVTGVDLQLPSREQPAWWAEVYDGQTWIPLDPVHGHFGSLPAFYIPLRKGGEALIMAENANISGTEIEIASIAAHKGLLSYESPGITDILDLSRLSPGHRETLSILLLLPIGVLATEIIRQIAGIRTYGTFTPTLIALAMIHVDWKTAVVVLFLVMTIGVLIRSAMPGLNLQRTPRLAVVFTLVAMCMSLVISGINHYRPGVDSTVVLLPIVVLTMLVDRIYTIYDELGIRTALVRLGWTAAAAAVSLLVVLQMHWGTQLVQYPELHAITLTLILLAGLYHGPKISDLTAFRFLREPPRRSGRDGTPPGQSPPSGDGL